MLIVFELEPPPIDSLYRTNLSWNDIGGKITKSMGLSTYMIFSLLPKTPQKNIVEKCGKVLTYSQKLYLCRQFGTENAN